MKTCSIAIRAMVFFVVLTGLAYPLFVTALAQLFFSDKANGSLVYVNHKVAGSKLIGQQFDSLIYFQSRPSASKYDGMASGGSNLAVTSADLREIVNQRMHAFAQANHCTGTLREIPEMFFASGSGLDPHISLNAALLQVERVSTSRKFTAQQTHKLIELVIAMAQKPMLPFMGNQTINVLLLNIQTDRLK